MLNFRNTNIFYGVLICAVLILNLFVGFHLLIYLLIAFSYSAILFYGCYYIDSQFFLPVICSVQTDKKQIAISFDDGPVENYTTEILKVLKENNIHAAFFCIGNRITGNQELLNRINNEGHLIGNHSQSHHFWFDLFSARKMKDDLLEMNRLTENITKLKLRFFRPPYGVINPNLKKAIQQCNFITIGWSVRSMDTVISDKNKLYNKVVNSLKPGAIILFHDTSKTTLDILPDFLRQTMKNGYEIVRLDTLLKLNAYA